MKRSVLALLLLCLVTGGAFSQKKETFIVKKAGQLVDYLSERKLKGLDTNYVGAPKKNWTILFNTYVSRMDFDLRSNVLEEEEFSDGPKMNRSVIDMHSKSDKVLSLGLYYMGYGLAYSQNLGKGFAKSMSLSLYSPKIGGEIRYHSTKNIKGTMDMEGGDFKMKLLGGEAKMENLILNAYYVFNPKKFSYASAMNYFALQKKSAGSVLAGFSAHRTRLTSYEGWLSYMLGRVNRLKINQFSIGAGYGYNWVPVTGLTVHVSEVPMLLITTRSSTKMKSSGNDGWDSTQKLGQKDLFGNKARFSFSHMFRVSVSYQMKDRYLFGASCLYNYYRVGKPSQYFMSNEDWSIRLFVGYRF